MTVGDTSFWDDFFQQNLIPAVLAYIITTWEQMPKPGPSDLEDVISDQAIFGNGERQRSKRFPFSNSP